MPLSKPDQAALQEVKKDLQLLMQQIEDDDGETYYIAMVAKPFVTVCTLLGEIPLGEK